MQFKGNWSWCLLEECVKGIYYARFHTAITATEKCTLILDLKLILIKSVEREM